MKWIGALLAIGMFLFTVNDAFYVSYFWNEFGSADIRRHLLFCFVSVALTFWHGAMTWRAWNSGHRVHVLLAVAFLVEVAIVFTYFGFLPVLSHAYLVEQNKFPLAMITGLCAIATIVLMRHAWRIASDASKSPARHAATSPRH